MFSSILLVAILSIYLVSVDLGTVQKCLEGNDHKKTPSPEGPGFVACLAWKDKTCCLPETTVELQKYEGKHVDHMDWDYCGRLSESCRRYMMNQECFYYCEPNLFKWQVAAKPNQYLERVPICSEYCDQWFETCKNDMTYSENWFDTYVMHHSEKGPITPKTPCRTFAEIFHDGEGLCNKLWGPGYKYEESSNCMVMNFKGKNPNDEVRNI